MTTSRNNPRLLAIRNSLAEVDTRDFKKGRISDWIDFPSRMHRWYKIRGTKISPTDVKQSKRVLRLWLAVYGSETTPEFDAKFERAYQAAMSSEATNAR
jgi:hypothetical protein